MRSRVKRSPLFEEVDPHCLKKSPPPPPPPVSVLTTHQVFCNNSKILPPLPNHQGMNSTEHK